MGKESGDPSMMSRMSEALPVWLASALDESEHEAVLGDLAESGDGGWKAVWEILGLLIRRQAGVWQDLRLWLVLVTLVLPLTILLSTVSQSVIAVGAVYSWMYVNNWDWELAKSAGFWFVLREAAFWLSTDCILLACWSWSAGFLLGRLPKQFARACQTALPVLLVLSQAWAVPQRCTDFFFGVYGPAPAALPDPNAPVTANAFYRVFFPWIVVVTLIVLPALLGARQGSPPALRNRQLRVLLATAAIASLITMLPRLPGFGLLLGDAGRQWVWHNRNVIQVVPIVACWPTFYMVAIRLRKYWRAGPALT